MSQNDSLNEGRIQPDDGLTEYTCVWVTQVSAYDPEQAAREAERQAHDGHEYSRTWNVAIGVETPIPDAWMEFDLDEIDARLPEMPVPTELLVNAYLGIYRILDAPDEWDHAEVLSRASADLALAFSRLTGQKIGERLGWDK